MADLLKLEMRKIGHLIGRHDAIDNRRAVDLERLIDLGVQLAGFRGPKAVSAASARECTEIRIRKFDARLVSRQADALRFERYQPERRIVVDDDLDGQLRCV